MQSRGRGSSTCSKKFQDSKNLATHYGPRGTFQNFTYTKPWAELEEIDYIYVKGWQVQQTASLTDSIDGRFPRPFSFRSRSMY